MRTLIIITGSALAAILAYKWYQKNQDKKLSETQIDIQADVVKPTKDIVKDVYDDVSPEMKSWYTSWNRIDTNPVNPGSNGRAF
jgi:hypothetical protein